MIPDRVGFSMAVVALLNRFQQPQIFTGPYGPPADPPEGRNLTNEERSLYSAAIDTMNDFVRGEIEPEPDPQVQIQHGQGCMCPQCRGYASINWNRPGGGMYIDRSTP